jgi:hypothetical protein
MLVKRFTVKGYTIYTIQKNKLLKGINIMLKTTVLFTLFFIASNSFATDYFFESNGKEVLVQFVGPLDDPTAVSFQGFCPESYYDKNAYTRQLMIDFFDAALNNKV